MTRFFCSFLLSALFNTIPVSSFAQEQQLDVSDKAKQAQSKVEMLTRKPEIEMTPELHH